MPDPLIHTTHDVPDFAWKCTLCDAKVGSLDIRFRCEKAPVVVHPDQSTLLGADALVRHSDADDNHSGGPI